MRIDWYTKGVLTVVALLLAAIVARDYAGPVGVVRADGGSTLLPSDGPSTYNFFDTRSGDIWGYDSTGVVMHHLHLIKPGLTLVRDK